MRPIQNLETKSWGGSAGDLEWSLQTLKTKLGGVPTAVRAVILRIRWTVNTLTGGGCTGAELMKWVSNITLKDRNGYAPVDGITLYNFVMLQHMALNLPVAPRPADVGANMTNASRFFQATVPFALQSLDHGDDFAIPTALLNGGSLRVRLGGAALNANTTVVSCSITPVIVYHQAATGLRIPPRVEYRQSTVSPYHSLEPGVYAGLLLDLSGAPTLVNISLSAAGKELIQSATPAQIFASYQADFGLPGLFPASDGDYTSMFPSIGDYDLLSTLGLPGLPLIWLERNQANNRVTQLVDTGGGPLAVEVDGPTSITLIWCRLDRVTNHRVNEILAAYEAAPESVIVARRSKEGGIIDKATAATTPGLASVPPKIATIINPVKSGLLR